MDSIKEDLEQFRKQLEKGSIRNAYRALLAFMMQLRNHFKNNLDDFTVSGLYQGYMDMTYFALFSSSLKQRNLKVPIVFNYETFGFEAWLSGSNRQVQRQYWELFKDSKWPAYRLVPQEGTWVDSILEYDLVTSFDLDDPDALTAAIETATLAFIDDIEQFLAQQQPLEDAGPGA